MEFSTALARGHTGKKHVWMAADLPDMSGKLALITGGPAGIGLQAARGLIARNAKVILAGRDGAAGQMSVDLLRREIPGSDVTFESLDLANLASVRACAEAVLERDVPLDFLLNVAGVMAVPTRRLTVDGFEMHMGVNHLGHFALTGRLLPALLRAPVSHVVTVASQSASYGKLNLRDLQSAKAYRPMAAYGQSKLANIAFGVELSARAIETRLISTPVHPGTAPTSIQRHYGGVTRFAGELIMRLIGQPLGRVADPLLFALTLGAEERGRYVGPTGFLQLSGAPGFLSPPAAALSADIRKTFWVASEELTKVHYDFDATG